MRLPQAFVVVIAIATVPVITAAQQFMPNLGPPVDPSARFEVAAIKAFDSGSGPFRVLMGATGGRFESHVPVGLLVRQALQKPDYQIAGMPGWVDTERYSITAKLPEGGPPTPISGLLMNLLKDRFQLAMHAETRDLPIFNLVVARPDGRLGPDLKPSSAECQATVAARIAAAKAAATVPAGPPPPLPTLPGPNDPLPCGFVRSPPGLMAASGRTMAELTPMLADVAGRLVVDKTGLAGLYDFTLKYAHEGRVVGLLALLGGTPPSDVDPDAPNIFTALQEQLGLKLESARGPVEVVVIDKIEKPTLD
jgi:uncharacterized protein (TIGR03435 family)